MRAIVRANRARAVRAGDGAAITFPLDCPETPPRTRTKPPPAWRSRQATVENMGRGRGGKRGGGRGGGPRGRVCEEEEEYMRYLGEQRLANLRGAYEGRGRSLSTS